VDEFGDGDVEFGEGNADVTADEGSTDIPDTIPEDSDVDVAPEPDDGYDVEPESFQEDVDPEGLEGGEVADDGEGVAEESVAGKPDDLPEDVSADDPSDGPDVTSDVEAPLGRGTGLTLDIDHSESGSQAQPSGLTLDIDHTGAADAAEGELPVDGSAGPEGEFDAGGDLDEDSAADVDPDAPMGTDKTVDLSEDVSTGDPADDADVTSSIEGSPNSDVGLEPDGVRSGTEFCPDSERGLEPSAEGLTDETDAARDTPAGLESDTSGVEAESPSVQEAGPELTIEHDGPTEVTNDGDELGGELPVDGSAGPEGEFDTGRDLDEDSATDVAPGASTGVDDMPDVEARGSLGQATEWRADVDRAGSMDDPSQGGMADVPLAKDTEGQAEGLSADRGIFGDAASKFDIPAASGGLYDQSGEDIVAGDSPDMPDRAWDVEDPSLSQYLKDHEDQNARYEEFRDKFENGELEQETLPKDQPLEWIQASEVCGVMGKDDVDSKEFWSHHGETRDRFGELITGGGEIKSRLDNGEDLDQILQDERLRKCWSALAGNPIRVSEYNGSYIFDGDGRHRLRMADGLGLPVPVKIAARFRQKADS